MIAGDSGEGRVSDAEARAVVKAGRSIQPMPPAQATDVARAPLFGNRGPREGIEPLANRRHERFCQLVAYEQRSFTDAYEAVFGGAKDSARANAARLKRTHPEVVARIAFLDGEIKAEAMIHRGATFCDTVNDVSGVLKSMMAQKRDPRAAAVALKAAEILLKATGNDAPGTVTTVEEERADVVDGGADALGTVRAALAKVRRTVVTEAGA